MKIFIFTLIFIIYMENNLANSNRNNVNNDQSDSNQALKNELIEFGFMNEHIDLALKITSEKQEAIDLYFKFINMQDNKNDREPIIL